MPAGGSTAGVHTYLYLSSIQEQCAMSDKLCGSHSFVQVSRKRGQPRGDRMAPEFQDLPAG